MNRLAAEVWYLEIVTMMRLISMHGNRQWMTADGPVNKLPPVSRCKAHQVLYRRSSSTGQQCESMARFCHGDTQNTFTVPTENLMNPIPACHTDFSAWCLPK